MFSVECILHRTKCECSTLVFLRLKRFNRRLCSLVLSGINLSNILKLPLSGSCLLGFFLAHLLKKKRKVLYIQLLDQRPRFACLYSFSLLSVLLNPVFCIVISVQRRNPQCALQHSVHTNVSTTKINIAGIANKLS